MTLKRKSEFASDYNWSKMSTFGGCKAIIEVAVDGLLEMEPFNDVQNKERTALITFESSVRKKLETFLFDQNGRPKTFNPDEINAMCTSEVDALVQTLKNQELKNKVYSVLMAACGFVLGILAVAPLGIPLCFASVRNYIGSFFASPKMSAQQFQAQMQIAITQLQQLTSNQIECFSDIDKHEYCFNNLSA